MTRRAVRANNPLAKRPGKASDEAEEKRRAELIKRIAPRQIEVRGAVRELRSIRDKEVLIEGPFGTGKTVGILSWIYQLLDTYPGITVLIVGKTRDHLQRSAISTWERHVVPPEHPMLAGAREKKVYHHINGSKVILGSLHNAKAIHKAKGVEYDLIYVCEADAITEEDYETLVGRLRSFVLPWRQIIIDCNPAHPQHWINQRAKRGDLVRLVSRHQDNPFYWDAEKNDWTPEGLDYVKGTLNRMRGVRYKRYVLGLWAANDGTVYEEYDPAVHDSDQYPNHLPYEWRRIWVEDFGFNHPHVWQQWAIDPDGNLWLEFEVYVTHTLLADVATMIREATRETPEPEDWLCDHDAQDRFEMEALLGRKTSPAYKAVRPGIDAMTSRLQVQAHGRPRIFFRTQARVHAPDYRLEDGSGPICTTDEFGYYRWSDKSKKDEPVKEHDDGMDCCRYAVAYVDKLGDNKPMPATLHRPVRTRRRVF